MSLLCFYWKFAKVSKKGLRRVIVRPRYRFTGGDELETVGTAGYIEAMRGGRAEGNLRRYC